MCLQKLRPTGVLEWIDSINGHFVSLGSGAIPHTAGSCLGEVLTVSTMVFCGEPCGEGRRINSSRSGITLLARPNSALDEEASLRYEYVQDYCTVMLRLVGGAGGGLLDPTDEP
jgi:hypothetical protein